MYYHTPESSRITESFCTRSSSTNTVWMLLLWTALFTAVAGGIVLYAKSSTDAIQYTDSDDDDDRDEQ